MKIVFCGHRELHDHEIVRNWLVTVCSELIADGAEHFYLGGYGAFDMLCADVLRQLKKEHRHIQLSLILPYPDTRRVTTGYDELIYPPLENVPRRFAIVRRNEWMVRSADVVVAYVMYDWGGAAKTLARARKLNKQIICFQNHSS